MKFVVEIRFSKLWIRKKVFKKRKHWQDSRENKAINKIRTISSITLAKRKNIQNISRACARMKSCWFNSLSKLVKRSSEQICFVGHLLKVQFYCEWMTYKLLQPKIVMNKSFCWIILLQNANNSQNINFEFIYIWNDVIHLLLLCFM